jgi:hypothetical protein
METKRTCKMCDKVLPLAEYHQSYSKKQKKWYPLSRCKACERQRYLNTRRDDPARYLLYSAKTRARKRGFECTLNKAWIQERLERGTCALTGIPFQETWDKRTMYSVSLDRIDSTLGYTPENCRLVLWGVNCALSNWGEDGFKIIAEAYLEYNK